MIDFGLSEDQEALQRAAREFLAAECPPALVRENAAGADVTLPAADLARMEAEGSLVRVIVHEMGHVIGIGTIWSRFGLLQGAGTVNPTLSGPNAMREFGDLLQTSTPTAVPVANTGGPGTRDSHWREMVFGNELMTGFLNTGTKPDQSDDHRLP